MAPFRHFIRYWLYTTPLAGLLTFTLGIATVYSLLNLSLKNSVILVAVASLVAAGVTFYYVRPNLAKNNIYLLGLSLVAIALFTYLCNYTSIHLGNRGFLFADGSDQLGYVQLANWLIAHPVTDTPIASPLHPDQSWVETVYVAAHSISAQRFGSYFLLALISLVHGTPAIFVYDLLCGIILSAAFLSICALWSRSPISFILLFLGLLTCTWFDYSRSGYLAKILAYPATLFILGILFAVIGKQLSLRPIIALVILSCATATLYPATTGALIIGLAGSIFLLSKLFFDVMPSVSKREKLILIGDQALLFALVALVLVATTGALAIPAHPAYGVLNAKWQAIILYMLDIIPAIQLSYPAIATASFYKAIVYFFITICLLVAAIIRRNHTAITLFATPLVMLAVLTAYVSVAIHYNLHPLVEEIKWVGYQLSSYFCALTFIGSIQLLDDSVTMPTSVLKKILVISLIHSFNKNTHGST